MEDLEEPASDEGRRRRRRRRSGEVGESIAGGGSGGKGGKGGAGKRREGLGRGEGEGTGGGELERGAMVSLCPDFFQVPHEEKVHWSRLIEIVTSDSPI